MFSQCKTIKKEDLSQTRDLSENPFSTVIDDISLLDTTMYQVVDYEFIKSITTDEFDEVNLYFEKPNNVEFTLIRDKWLLNDSVYGYLVLFKYPVGAESIEPHSKVNLILTNTVGDFLNQITLYQDYDLNRTFIGLTSRIIGDSIQSALTSKDERFYYKINNRGFFEEITSFESYTVKNRRSINKIESDFLKRKNRILFPSMFIENQKNRLSTLTVYGNSRTTLVNSHFLSYKKHGYYESFYIINQLSTAKHTIYELVEIKYLLSNISWIGTTTLDYHESENDFLMIIDE